MIPVMNWDDLRIIGITRSGNQAILQWLLTQIQGR
jgi:hypothetical protein